MLHLEMVSNWNVCFEKVTYNLYDLSKGYKSFHVILFVWMISVRQNLLKLNVNEVYIIHFL